jgi:hypothetical protein
MRKATIAITLAALLAGCGTLAENGTSTMPQAPLGHGRALPGQSWMDSGSSGDDLVYISNADGEVTVYDYQTQDLVGVLADFESPTGECVDKSGNVYIADTTKKVIYEYAHGGTKAIKALDDSPYVPNGCSVDPTTGNLAVANSEGSSSEGNVAVYAHASGKPTLYTDKSISNFPACAYDDDGNLLVTGTEGSTYESTFAWLPKRIGKLVNIEVPGPNPSWTWRYVSGIQWDGKFFALDEYYVYQIALMNGQAYYVGETELDADYVGNGQYGIYDPNPKRQGTQLLAGYNDESYGSGAYYFPYPAGGQPDASFSHGVDKPHAVTVSLAK